MLNRKTMEQLWKELPALLRTRCKMTAAEAKESAANANYEVCEDHGCYPDVSVYCTNPKSDRKQQWRLIFRINGLLMHGEAYKLLRVEELQAVVETSMEWRMVCS